jgi:beta-glucanase (GH16 family)
MSEHWPWITMRARRATRRAITIAVATLAVAACVPPPPRGAGGMRLTFRDEFTTLDHAKWNDMDSTYLDTNGVENVFRAANVSVWGGALWLSARREADGTVTSGLVATGRSVGGRVTFTTGEGFVEVRARFPAAAGAWPAIWLNNPGDGTVPAWPAGGEIDIAEFYGDHPSAVESNYHWEDDGEHRSAGAGTHPVRDVTQWHTYGVGIHPDRLEYFYDGVKVRTVTATTSGMRRGLSYAHAIVLDLAIGGSGPQDAGYRAGRAPLPYAAEFDYVRVWQP